MALIAHYKCDEQDNAEDLNDSSGHANDHTLPLSIAAGSGFGHRRIFTPSWTYSGDSPNDGDFAVNGECTVMAWVRPLETEGNETFVISFGDEGGTQAENYLWSLRLDMQASVNKFGMFWQYGTGNGVVAWSPADALAVYQERMKHICCIRTINGSNRDVKFVLEGVDMAADVTGLTAPDGGTVPDAGCNAFRHCRHGSPWGLLDAAVANIRFYDHALSVGDVLAIYNAELPDIVRSGLPLVSVPLIGSQGATGQLYEPAHTGSMLNPSTRPRSGWSSERP